jgi:hypothetical protein
MQILRMSCRAGRVMCQAARRSGGGLPPAAAPKLRASLLQRAGLAGSGPALNNDSGLLGTLKT